MNVATVQKEIEAWGTEEQDQLAAYLAALRLRRTGDHARELARRSNDRKAESWLSLDEVKKKLRGAQGQA